MIFNTAQHLAITTLDQNLIVVAGAGSGKTRVLVERYLNLLEQNPTWALNSLVAITFTQKAASEMRDRVRQTLTKRLSESQADTKAAERWAAHLSAMDSARIDTIHALCASILRANAAEAGVDPDFEVLDEVQAALLLDDVINDFLRKIALSNPPDPALRIIRDYEIRNVRPILKQFAVASEASKLKAVPEDLMVTWGNAWRENAVDQVLAFVALIPTFTIYEPRGSDALSTKWAEMSNQLKEIAMIAAGEGVTKEDFGAFAAACRLLEDISKMRMPGAITKAWGDEGAPAKAMLATIKQSANIFHENIGSAPNGVDNLAAELIPLWDSLVRRANSAYRAAKLERAALDFDDLEMMTRDLLVNFPHVCARYRDAEFKHLLVDEFQDTNANQWDIVRALADVGRGGSLFVVGDPKQSIYAFRGADVSVFDGVREQFILLEQNQEVNMALSFRSHQGLVSAFNFLFEKVLLREEASPVKRYHVRFEAMQANRLESPASVPPVEFILLDKEKLGDDNSTENGRKWEADALAKYLRAIVEDENRIVYDRHTESLRPIKYGDIALLFQTMTNVGIYEDALKQSGLPYVTIAGRGYYDRQEVWDMLNLLRALHNPADNLALAAALRSPMFAFSDDLLFALRSFTDAEGKRLSLWDVLSQADQDFLSDADKATVQFAASCLSELRALAGRVTMAELLRAALDATGYLAILSGLPDGARRRGNVEKLLDKALASGQSNLGAFSQYLTDLSERETREGEALLESEDAIKLMTVHKSKGLEFPLVVVADASRRLHGNIDKSALLNTEDGLACLVPNFVENKLDDTYAYKHAAEMAKLREEAERKRLLYVAATRAQDYLIFSGQVIIKKDTLSGDGWMKWLLSAFELSEIPTEGTLDISYAWGELRLHAPALALDTTPLQDDVTAWDVTPNPSGRPPLTHPVPIEQDAPVRSMSATQIANLGSAILAKPKDRAVYIARWRSHSPTQIERVSDRNGRGFGRRVGEIVHRVLCVADTKATQQEIARMVEAFAWEEGFVEVSERQRAVTQATKLLDNIQQSDVYAWIESAKQVFRELPFVYRTEKRNIHGIIDVLIQQADGNWVIIDYKSNWAEKSQLAEDARRFELQIGVYAAAINALIGVVPRTYIHYLRYNKTVEIHELKWRESLANLESNIGDLMRDDPL